MPSSHSSDVISLADFKTHFNAGKTQLVSRWVPGDLETPVGAYLKLCGEQPYSFLLESVEGGQTLGRYSIIGFDPDLIWTCVGKTATVSGAKDEVSDDPLTSLKANLAQCKIDVAADELPPMAVSGLFGYMGYDMIRLVEDIPDRNPDDLGIADGILIRPQVLVIFDNVKNMMCFVTPVYAHAGRGNESAEDVYAQAVARLDAAFGRLGEAVQHVTPQTKLSLPLEVSSNTSREKYHDAVNKAVAYIEQGEIFQVVPGQRFSMPFDLPAFALYRSLRRLNPSPFMFHLSFDGFAIVGSSPEILVRVRDNTVTIRPIAGTRKRGATSAEDAANATELLADEKEQAEHLMLLDLGRNDVGRVSETGSVRVTERSIVEYYSHVMHIVSNVEGTLRSDMDSIDALFAGFPAGTVSGAPKIRAMEIIDELEVSKRSYYGGCVGYLSGNGDIDTAIALRTALVKDGQVYVQAGGGVVVDSDGEFEYQESISKAQAIVKAAQMAVEQADRVDEN